MNLRHVSIAAFLGILSYKAVDMMKPQWLLDPATGKERATPTQIGVGVGALAMFALYTGRAEGLSGSGDGNFGNISTFYGDTVSPF
jgi:hypothetical protein